MKKRFVPVFVTAFLYAVLLTLTSCNNFLKSENISNEIKDTIAYNNAQIVKVNLYCKEGMGTINPDNYYDAHLGYDFKLQFIPNTKNYKLRNPEKVFEAVNIKNEAKRMSDYVKITYIPQTDEEGVYSYNVKVLKASDDIRICLIDDPNPPEFNTIRIARTKDDAIKGTNLIPYEVFTGDDENANPNLFIHYADNLNYEGDSSQVAQNIQDHHVNKFWIYFEAEDSESGVDYIEVKEQLIRQTYGNTIQGIIYDKSTNERTNSIYNKTGNNNFSACFEYNFLSSEDGVVRIELTAFDNGGKYNTSAQKIDFIKDTVCNLTVNFEAKEEQFVEKYENLDDAKYEIKLEFKDEWFGTRYISDLNGNDYRDQFTIEPEGDFSMTGNLISFEYGYDKNNMTRIVFQNQDFPIVEIKNSGGTLTGYVKEPVISFPVNPYKTVYINATIEDLAGNRITSWLEITPVPDIVGANIEVTNKKGKITLITKNQTEGGLVLNTDNDSLVLTHNNNVRNILETIYKNKIPDKVRFVQRNNMGFYGKSIILRKCKSDENQIENDSFEIDSDDQYETPTASDLPDITVNVDSPINTGKKNVRIVFAPGFIPNPDFVYLYSYYDENGKEIFFQNTTFELEYATVKQELWVYAYNKAGVAIKSESYEIDITYDNVAPFIGPFSIYKISQGKCLASLLYTDVDHYNDKSYGNSGIKEIKYLFSEDYVDGNSIDWDNDPNIKIPEEKDPLTTSQYTHTYLFDYSYCNTLPSCLYIYVKDNKNNYSIKEFYPFIKETVFNYTLEYKDSSFKFECVVGDNNFIKPLCEYITNGTWQPIDEAIGYGYLSLANSTDRIHAYTNFALTQAEMASFIRISPFDSDIQAIGPSTFYYPPYLIDKDSYTCELKDMVIGLSGINIFADQPCFVHTIYCRSNLGEKPEDWMGYEYKYGFEVGAIIKQKSFTYSNDYIDQVPSGYYYTTIVHFADGSMMMTPVEKMP